MKTFLPFGSREDESEKYIVVSTDNIDVSQGLLKKNQSRALKT